MPRIARWLTMGLVCMAAALPAVAARPGSGASASAAARAGVPLDVRTRYAPARSGPVLIRDATVFDGRGGMLRPGSVLLVDGRIAEIGAVVAAPAGAQIIDGRGKWVTPGIIDVHSHLGAAPSPSVRGHGDINETSGPIQPGVRVEDAIWPQDPGFSRALAGGVTAMQILPGSANLIGGHTVVIKNVGARSVAEMKFPGAAPGVKMACGENPKTTYNLGRGWGSLGVAPTTRMGNFKLVRSAFIEAQRWRDGQRDAADIDWTLVGGELGLQTLLGILRGEVVVHVHCHRADEMALMMTLASDFGFRIGAFHHAPEAYKIADLLAREGVCAALWSDWWGYTMESLDAVPENLPMTQHAGACVMIHSDHAIGIQHLNQEVASALADGRAMGLTIDDAKAWEWLSLNPARLLRIDDRVGTLESGKMGDVVLWDGHPFSIYTRAEKVYIDGALAYSRTDPVRLPLDDFELGLSEREDLQ